MEEQRRIKAILKVAIILLIGLIVLLVIFKDANAASKEVKWNPPIDNCDATPLADLSGFTVWWGQTPRPPDPPSSCSAFVDETLYPNSFMVGPSDTQAVISVFDEEVERTFFIAITAWDSKGNQSQYSNELEWIVPPMMVAPNRPTNLRDVMAP